MLFKWQIESVRFIVHSSIFSSQALRDTRIKLHRDCENVLTLGENSLRWKSNLFSECLGIAFIGIREGIK